MYLLFIALVGSLSGTVCGNHAADYRLGVGCIGCYPGGPGTQAATASAFVAEANARFHDDANVATDFFDIGPGTIEGVLARYDALIEANFTMLLVVSVLTTNNTVVDMFTRVRQVHPTFHVMLFDNGAPEESVDLPWMATIGARLDEMGYLAGYMAGTMTATGRVAIETATVQWWQNKVTMASFSVGVKEACPHCLADIQVAKTYLNDTYRPGELVDRGADVMVCVGTSAAVARIKALIAAGYRNVTFVVVFNDIRGQLSPAEQAFAPYSIWFDSITVPLQQMDRLRRGLPFEAGLYLSSVQYGTMPLVGCLQRVPGTPPTTPCASCNVPMVKHQEIIRKHAGLGTRRPNTGILLTDDATLAVLAHPQLRAFSVRSLADAQGDHRTFATMPVPLVLGGFKILLMAPPFTDLTSYLYSANAISHMQPRDGFLADRVAFAAATFDSFAVLVGGVLHQSSLISADVVRIQHSCTVARAETCTQDPTADVVSMHPRGGRLNACAAAIAPDMLFVHGGVTFQGATVADAFLYNLTSDEWTEAGDAPNGRAHHTCTAWTDPSNERHCVVVMGGVTSVGAQLTDSMLYCVGNGWHRTAKSSSAPGALRDPCVVPSGDVLHVFGGEAIDLNQAAPNTLWTLSMSTLTWHRSDLSDHSEASSATLAAALRRRPDAAPLTLPSGRQRCVVVQDLAATPHNQTTPGFPNFASLKTFLRVFVFPVDTDGESVRTQDMAIVTLPWVSCWARNGLALSPDGFGCIDPTHAEAKSDRRTMIIVVITLVCVAGAVGIAALSVRYVQVRRARLRQRSERMWQFVPLSPVVTMATVVVRPSPIQNTKVANSDRTSKDGCEPESERTGAEYVHVMQGLRAIAHDRGVYEARCFGDSLTFASNDANAVAAMLVHQFDYVHAEYPGFTLRAAMHVGKPRKVVDEVRRKVVFVGKLSVTIVSLLRWCKDGELVWSASSRARVRSDTISASRCHVSEEVPLEAVDLAVVYVRPQASAAVRAVGIQVPKPNPRAVPFQVSNKSRVRKVDLDIGMSKLMYRELLRVTSRTCGQQVVTSLFKRLDLTARAPSMLASRKLTPAQKARYELEALCSALTKEYSGPFLAVTDCRVMNVMSASANPLTLSLEGEESTRDPPTHPLDTAIV